MTEQQTQKKSAFLITSKTKNDIIGLQECHLTTNGEANSFSLGNNHSARTNRSHIKKTDGEHDRLLIQEVTADSKTILTANCYAPQSTLDKIQLYRHVRSIIEEQNKDDHPIILLGDFNSVMSSELDIITGAPHSHI